jgi:hypothetical protein
MDNNNLPIPTTSLDTARLGDTLPPINVPAQGWRAVLPVHAAADMFPRMSESGLRELGESIKKNGLKLPIVLWADPDDAGKVYLLDGRNRLDGMALVGIKFEFRQGKKGGAFGLYSADLRLDWDSYNGCGSVDFMGEDPYEFVISANVLRRHLTAEEKRELIATVLKATPEKSNRQIAEQVKVDHKTVAKVREEGERTGEIPQLTETTGKDGKARTTKRRQPEKKASPVKAASVENTIGLGDAQPVIDVAPAVAAAPAADHAAELQYAIGHRVPKIDDAGRQKVAAYFISTIVGHASPQHRRKVIADLRAAIDRQESLVAAWETKAGHARAE